MNLHWEKVWPWLGAVAVTAIWWFVGKPFPKSPDGLLGAAATVASVFASFLGVSKAIILTIKGTRTYKALEKSNYIDSLFAYLRVGIYGAVAFASISLLGFFVEPNLKSPDFWLYQWYCCLWVTSGALALFTYIRIANILFKLLKQPEVTTG